MRRKLIAILCLFGACAYGQVWKGELGDPAASKELAEAGDPAALADVAFLFGYCLGGFDYDPQRIFDYSRRSAEAGNSLGMAGLAYCYMNGCGVEQDPEKAYAWATKSAEAGNPAGKGRLATCYQLGFGVAANPDRAHELFKQAAKAGVITVLHGEANHRIRGDGRPADQEGGLAELRELVRKHDWYWAAADMVAWKVARPKLQVINASDEVSEVFWLNGEGDRISNGEIKPGEDKIISTTIGHRFVIVGRDSGTEVRTVSRVPVQGMRFNPEAREGMSAFYTQRVEVGGFPIVASATVSPFALKEAAFLVGAMLSKRDDVREAMIKSGARLCIMVYDEFTTDLPEFADVGKGEAPRIPGISRKDFWDARARGLGGSATDPFCSCGEENLLGYPGDPYEEESILIHEFTHNIHLRGMVNVEKTAIEADE